MTRRGSVHAYDNHTVIPTGGRIDAAPRGSDKTVDHAISHVDRNRRHIPRKVQEPSKIFVPLDLNEIPRDPNRGKTLHSDPFAEDRMHVEFRRAKQKVMTPRGPARPPRRIVKPVAAVSHTERKNDFIATTGVVHTSPKRVPKEKHSTTINDAQPPKSYVGSRRFAANPDRNGSKATPDALSMSSMTISQVFPSEAKSLMSPVSEQRRLTVKPNPQRYQLTMEGVFSPMRGGKAPKPSSLAPWMQDQRPAITGKKHAGASIMGAATPFAIEARKE